MLFPYSNGETQDYQVGTEGNDYMPSGGVHVEFVFNKHLVLQYIKAERLSSCLPFAVRVIAYCV